MRDHRITFNFVRMVTKKSSIISFLLVILLFTGSVRESRTTGATSQAQILPTCDAGCDIPVNINAVSNVEHLPGGGHQAEVRWALGQVREEMKVINVTVSVEFTLRGGKVQRGEKIAKADDRITIVSAKGLITDGDPVSCTVTIRPAALIKLEDQFKVEVLGAKFIEQKKLNGNVVVEALYRITAKTGCRPARRVDLEASMKVGHPLPGGSGQQLLERTGRASVDVPFSTGREESVKILIDAGPRETPRENTVVARPRLVGETLVGCGLKRVFETN